MPGADEFLDAFWELSTDRPVGMTVGAIPFSSINAYAARFWIDDPDEFLLLVSAIRACDRVYLEHARKGAEQ